jgi:hypothetical protein
VRGVHRNTSTHHGLVALQIVFSLLKLAREVRGRYRTYMHDKRGVSGMFSSFWMQHSSHWTASKVCAHKSV